MDVSILATSGGPHPPDKWASLSASKIADLIQVDMQSNSDAATAARKAKPQFILNLASALEASFSSVAAAERNSVKSGAVKQRNAAFNIDANLKSAIGVVLDTAAPTPFAEHFKLSDVQKAVSIILQQHFIDAANIERSWAFDAKGL